MRGQRLSKRHSGSRMARRIGSPRYKGASSLRYGRLYLRIDCALLSLMVDPDAHECKKGTRPDLRLAGLYAYLVMKAAQSKEKNHSFCVTWDEIETEIGLSPRVARNHCLTLEVAGLLRHWLHRDEKAKATNKGVGPKNHFILYPQVLTPLIQRKVPWPSKQIKEAFNRAKSSYSAARKNLLTDKSIDDETRQREIQGLQRLKRMALMEYSLVRMNPEDRLRYLQNWSFDASNFLGEPSAQALRQADGGFYPSSDASVSGWTEEASDRASQRRTEIRFPSHAHEVFENDDENEYCFEVDE